MRVSWCCMIETERFCLRLRDRFLVAFDRASDAYDSLSNLLLILRLARLGFLLRRSLGLESSSSFELVTELSFWCDGFIDLYLFILPRGEKVSSSSFSSTFASLFLPALS